MLDVNDEEEIARLAAEYRTPKVLECNTCKRKFKTPKKFRPSMEEIDDGILDIQICAKCRRWMGKFAKDFNNRSKENEN